MRCCASDSWPQEGPSRSARNASYSGLLCNGWGGGAQAGALEVRQLLRLAARRRPERGRNDQMHRAGGDGAAGSVCTCMLQCTGSWQERLAACGRAAVTHLGQAQAQLHTLRLHLLHGLQIIDRGSTK